MVIKKIGFQLSIGRAREIDFTRLFTRRLGENYRFYTPEDEKLYILWIFYTPKANFSQNLLILHGGLLTGSNPGEGTIFLVVSAVFFLQTA